MDEKTKKVIDLLKFSELKNTTRKKKQKKDPDIHISGSNNVIGDGNVTISGDLHIIQNQRSRQKRVSVKKEGVITEKQASEIKELLFQWVDAEKDAETELSFRSKPLTHGYAWRLFWRQFDITSYKDLPAVRFDDAKKWLKQKKAAAYRVSGASQKVSNWRSERIKAIKSRCKNQLKDEYAYSRYIKEKFNKSSLTQLTDMEIELVYNHIMAKK